MKPTPAKYRTPVEGNGPSSFGRVTSGESDPSLDCGTRTFRVVMRNCSKRDRT